MPERNFSASVAHDNEVTSIALRSLPSAAKPHPRTVILRLKDGATDQQAEELADLLNHVALVMD